VGLKDQVRRKQALSDDYYVPADDAQARRLKQAESQHSLALFTGDEEQIEEAESKLEAVRAEVAEAGVHFHIVSVGRVRFEELVREHPPESEEAKAHKAQFEPDTFWPALLSESVDPGEMTPEEWDSEVLRSKAWGPGELRELQDRVMAVNTGSRVAELGN
jgi:hypothetical protein